MARGGTPQQERSIATRQRLLDAALDELIERGYEGFSALAVSKRARISRGAQQHHFPRTNDLVAATVRRLFERQKEELAAAKASGPPGPARTARALDVVFGLYQGPLFSAMLELSLAGTRDAELHDVISRVEREFSDDIAAWARSLVVGDSASSETLQHRLAVALGAARGIALLRLLGHPERTIAAQWRHARQEIVDLLSDEADVAGGGRR